MVQVDLKYGSKWEEASQWVNKTGILSGQLAEFLGSETEIFQFLKIKMHFSVFKENQGSWPNRTFSVRQHPNLFTSTCIFLITLKKIKNQTVHMFLRIWQFLPCHFPAIFFITDMIDSLYGWLITEQRPAGSQLLLKPMASNHWFANLLCTSLVYYKTP